MDNRPSKQPHPSTYAEDRRECAICHQDFKVHRYNRHRTTCSRACSLKLRSVKQKEYLAAHPEIKETWHRKKYDDYDYGPRFDDPRDHKQLAEALFILTFAPCRKCGDTKFYRLERYNGYMYICMNQNCRQQKSVRTGTILERSYTPLPIWMEAIRKVWGEGEVRSVQMSEHLGVTHKHAWGMVRKIRGLTPTHPLVQLAKYPDRPPVRGSLVATHSAKD
jgi:hypothetical protein